MAAVTTARAKPSGLKLFVDGTEPDAYTKGDKLDGSIALAKPCEVGRRDGKPNFVGSLDDLRFYDRALFADEVGQLAGYADVLDALALKPAKRRPEQRELLQSFYFAQRDEPSRKLHAELARRPPAGASTLLDSTPTAMVMEEMPQPRETFMLVRGQYDKHGEKVSPGVPEPCPPLPAGAAANRLGLARWLVAPQHPLTARVIVEPLLADVLRHGTGEDGRGFRLAGRVSHASRAARLAGLPVARLAAGTSRPCSG